MGEELPVGGSFEWAAHMVLALYECGVRHAVISPGSRSTPLTMAFAGHPGMQTHVVLDERSAAFMALGIGKAADRPSALVCTSGTAAANYLPALWEARNSGTPMVVLTADRPPSLRGTGASQTLDQLKLYGEAAVFFHECGEPQPDPAAIRRLRRAARQAVSDAVTLGGPAHLNLPFRKPFEPGETAFERARSLFASQTARAEGGFDGKGAERGAFLPLVDAGWGAEGVEFLQTHLHGSKRPLVVIGPMNPSDPLYAAVAGWRSQRGGGDQVVAPVLADPGAPGWPVGDPPPLVAGAGEPSIPPPDLLIRVGDTPYTGPMLSALEAWCDVPTLLVHSRPTWQDPFSARSQRITTRSAATLHAIDKAVGALDREWVRKVESSSEHAKRQVQRITAQWRQEAVPLTDLQALHELWRRAPSGWPVFSGNSLLPRDIALLGPALPPRRVLTNRGVAGIDGILSTAAGASLALDTGMIVFTGDLGFLHDSNALLLGRHLKHPVLVGLIDNGGGSIFDMLPVAASWPDGFDRYFNTPQAVEFGLLCQAHGIGYTRVEAAQGERSRHPETPARSGWIPHDLQSPGFHVVHLTTDRAASHRQRRRLQERTEPTS